MTTFSHKMMASIMVTYFWGVIVGSINVLFQDGSLESLLVYIGGVAAVAVGFYCWKAKAENVVKLSNTDFEKVKEVGY